MVLGNDAGPAAECGKADPQRPGVGESHEINNDSRRWKAILLWIAPHDPDYGRAHRVTLIHWGVKIGHDGAPMMLIPWCEFTEPCPE